MELTGRPSFTVHDSCTHDRPSRSFVSDVAFTPCACTPETRSHASNITGAVTRMPSALGIRDFFFIGLIQRCALACTPRKLVQPPRATYPPVSYTHLRAHETPEHLVCRLLLEKKK